MNQVTEHESESAMAAKTAVVPNTSSASPELPTLYDYPESDVVIYDGDCSFCRQQVNRLARWDGRNRISFISLHDEYVAEHFSDLTHDQMMEQIFVVNRTGLRKGGADAIRYLSRKLPKLWWLAPLMHIPFSLPLWQWGYMQVAKRRYRISQKLDPSCDDGSCEVHFKS
jgi:predicted DCC family thiol-disulfide oxidoreductase YuxK